MAKKSPVAVFLAATAMLASSSMQTNLAIAGEKEKMGGLKEWTTDQGINEESIPDAETKAAEKKAKKQNICIPIGEGENCW